MAKKDWKKALLDAVDALGDRVRDALEAIDALIAPQPVPVPVRPTDGRRPQR